MSKKNDVFTMPIEALGKQVAAAIAAAEAIQSDLAGLVAYTAAERKASQGRFRNGEADALLSVLAAAEQQPQLFASLADKDFGADPNAFEIQVLRDRLQRASKLLPLADALDALNAKISDTVLHLSAETRPVMLEAYAIAKSVAKTDPKLRGAISPALDFFSRIGRQAAETRGKQRDNKT